MGGHDQSVSRDHYSPGNVVFPQYSSQFVYAPDYRNAYVQSWNLTLEREIGLGFVVRSSYAGSKGTALAVGRELNPAVYACPASPPRPPISAGCSLRISDPPPSSSPPGTRPSTLFN